jgi:uncharacterized protein with HEPN domain
MERYGSRVREVLEEDELFQVWILYDFHIIGKAAARLGKAFLEAHPHCPGGSNYGNAPCVEYFGVDLNDVWKTVEQDLPTLK